MRLAVDGYMPGQRIHQYVRDQWWGELQKLNVEIIPLARLYGVDGDTVYLQHATNGEPIVLEGVDTLVASLGHERVNDLEDELEGWTGELHLIGDCLTPRTAEVLETPAPKSTRRPSLPTMPSTSCLREMLSDCFLKPKVRRMM